MDSCKVCGKHGKCSISIRPVALTMLLPFSVIPPHTFSEIFQSLSMESSTSIWSLHYDPEVLAVSGDILTGVQSHCQ